VRYFGGTDNVVTKNTEVAGIKAKPIPDSNTTHYRGEQHGLQGKRKTISHSRDHIERQLTTCW
jgi:hypothetical protein